MGRVVVVMGIVAMFMLVVMEMLVMVIVNVKVVVFVVVAVAVTVSVSVAVVVIDVVREDVLAHMMLQLFVRVGVMVVRRVHVVQMGMPVDSAGMRLCMRVHTRVVAVLSRRGTVRRVVRARMVMLCLGVRVQVLVRRVVTRVVVHKHMAGEAVLAATLGIRCASLGMQANVRVRVRVRVRMRVQQGRAVRAVMRHLRRWCDGVG